MMTVEMIGNDMTLATIQLLATRQHPHEIAWWYIIDMTSTKVPKTDATVGLINVAPYSLWTLIVHKWPNCQTPVTWDSSD
ncbi:hypothetical protein HNQ39_002208 [Armatimonas rosea]|uniref:Uncharacterized protein n=1 Tax=Armatimonas rosea TaxID=685828 RepID=A0A7W9W7A3_ARMRO|nr:hypothetical protein [Armatimonas rosea]